MPNSEAPRVPRLALSKVDAPQATPRFASARWDSARRRKTAAETARLARQAKTCRNAPLSSGRTGGCLKGFRKESAASGGSRLSPRLSQTKQSGFATNGKQGSSTSNLPPEGQETLPSSSPRKSRRCDDGKSPYKLIDTLVEMSEKLLSDMKEATNDSPEKPQDDIEELWELKMRVNKLELQVGSQRNLAPDAKLVSLPADVKELNEKLHATQEQLRDTLDQLRHAQQQIHALAQQCVDRNAGTGSFSPVPSSGSIAQHCTGGTTTPPRKVRSISLGGNQETRFLERQVSCPPVRFQSIAESSATPHLTPSVSMMPICLPGLTVSSCAAPRIAIPATARGCMTQVLHL